jgi:hypothetical protein
LSDRSTEKLIAELSADARPARPLAPPARRSLATLAAVAIAGAAAIMLLSEPATLTARYAGREQMMALEMAAALATGVLAVTAAFFLAVPGGSRKWLWAPSLPLAAWLGLSSIGCWTDLVRRGGAGLKLGHSADCLLFILGASLALGVPIVWALARARPIDPVPVAAMAGLGIAALAAFLLQFFHPFAITFLDLGIHLAAILIVVAAATLLNRRMLRPA